jgi:hypothetical protein
METTEVSETSTLSIHTPGNYPKEEITRYSKHGESLKTIKLNYFTGTSNTMRLQLKPLHVNVLYYCIQA